jgi:hypothetical protein
MFLKSKVYEQVFEAWSCICKLSEHEVGEEVPEAFDNKFSNIEVYHQVLEA